MLTFENLTSTTDADVSDDKLIDSFTPADGYAYGIELFVQKTLGKLTGWIAYTNSIARKVMTSQLNGTKEEYYTNWDRSHVFNILGNYSFNKT